MVDSEEASVVAGEDFTVVARGEWADPGDTKHSLGLLTRVQCVYTSFYTPSVIKVFSLFTIYGFCKN